MDQRQDLLMKLHHTQLHTRMKNAALRHNHCRYRVVAVGIDHRGRFISIKTNIPRLETRSYHAEERVIYGSPLSLARIVIARYNKRGDRLPIDPCEECRRLAEERGIVIEEVEK